MNLKNESDIQEYLQSLLEQIGDSKYIIADKILSVDAKRAYVTNIVSYLESAKSDQVSIPASHSLALESLKHLCREVDGSDPFFTENTMQVLIKHSRFDLITIKNLSSANFINCMKCVCNMQVMNPESRHHFTTLLNPHHLLDSLKFCTEQVQKCNKISSMTIEPLFLILRLCFFSSATDTKLSPLLVQLGILETLAKILKKIRIDTLEPTPTITLSVLVNDVLKTAFNLTVHLNQKSNISLIAPLSILGSADKIVNREGNYGNTKLQILLLEEIIATCLANELTDPSMAPPHSHAIHALLNFPLESLEEVWFPNNSLLLIDYLISILRNSISYMCPENKELVEEQMFGYPVDQTILILLMLLKKLAGHANAREKMRLIFMPADIDRSKPITEGKSFTATLIRIMSSIQLIQTRDFVCDLMICLLGNDTNQFIRYVGYGNAAGYLFSKGILEENTDIPTNSHEKYALDDNISIMTGSIEQQKPDPFAGMTDEEKDRESERLFVLFDRMKKTGVIKVVNKN